MADAARLVSTLLAVVVAASGLVACGSDKPPICDDIDALQASVGNLEDVQLGENGLNALSTNLKQIRQDVQQLTADAKSEFGDDVSNIDSAVTSLQASVTAAKSDPSASTLSAVGTAIEGVGSSLLALQDAVSGSC